MFMILYKIPETLHHILSCYNSTKQELAYLALYFLPRSILCLAAKALKNGLPLHNFTHNYLIPMIKIDTMILRKINACYLCM